MTASWMKGLVAGVLAGSFVFAAASAFAGAPEDGNGRRGKFVWKKQCRTCHDGSQAGAPTLSPVSMTQKAWVAKMDAPDALPCHKDWKVDEKDVKDIYKYLYEHALDSDQPETCG